MGVMISSFGFAEPATDIEEWAGSLTAKAEQRRKLLQMDVTKKKLEAKNAEVRELGRTRAPQNARLVSWSIIGGFMVVQRVLFF